MTNKEQKTLEGLQKAYNNCWDIFLHGDGSGTKPGDIRVYGVIAGIREVAEGRMKAMEQSGQMEK